MLSSDLKLHKIYNIVSFKKKYTFPIQLNNDCTFLASVIKCILIYCYRLKNVLLEIFSFRWKKMKKKRYIETIMLINITAEFFFQLLKTIWIESIWCSIKQDQRNDYPINYVQSRRKYLFIILDFKMHYI